MAKKKKKKGRIIKALFFAVFFALILLVFHYLYFEMSRIEGYNVKLFQDWKSYVAYVFSKIPFLKERVQYQPLMIGSASKHYEIVFSGTVKEISEKLKELERREKEVERLRTEYEKLIEVLGDLKKTWEDEMKELQMQKEAYVEGKSKIEDLAKLLRSSDPEGIAKTIAQETLDVETLSAALKLLPEDVSAEIVQELSKIDPEKSAQILKEMGGVDRIYQKMDEERKRLEDLLKKTIYEMEKLVNTKALKENLENYLDELSAEDIVKLMVDLNLDVDTIGAILSLLTSSKFGDVMSILQNEHPEIFKAVVERGVRM